MECDKKECFSAALWIISCRVHGTGLGLLVAASSTVRPTFCTTGRSTVISWRSAWIPSTRTLGQTLDLLVAARSGASTTTKSLVVARRSVWTPARHTHGPPLL